MFTKMFEKIFRGVAHRLGERRAFVDVGANSAEHHFEPLVLDLVDERRQRLDDRNVRFDERRELTGHQGRSRPILPRVKSRC